MSCPDEPIKIDYRSNHIRIIDCIRPAGARSGRHPDSDRDLSAIDDQGNCLVTAWQFPNRDHWRIDIESPAFKLIGIKALGSKAHGFWVRTEEEAVDWLEFLGRAVTR
ncbi:hypothetical protein [Mycolicibacterium phocaicum]|uniref:Uncharacterized protein n=1 Tax=Mycolicibacterium phocaicum TaxID=319706 RepID=A0A7I7ZW75_9MYCO|nr:hypothetical protein [Mycolicibacterium phocaicum]TLH61011.1 hypothetical protein C1S79_25825 [Mycolicibacterium phocaicum]BBZ57061.1 hypothetical protein MPHO_40530 [Mycolicibacterium phocaicum]